MAQVVRNSPYTVPGSDPSATDPALLAGVAAYAVPGPMESAKDPRFGWDNSGGATALKESTTGTPDASRMKHAPLFETRPGEGNPVSWWRRFTRDTTARYSVEYQDADGHEVAPKFLRRMKPRPVPSDAGETRPTMRMNPHTYVFTRPVEAPMVPLNGVHFSMADHRRDYPILGMEPPRKIRRNTYRIEPEPWDTNLVDMPAPVDSSPDAGVVAVNVPPAGNRAWRL